MAVLPKDGEVLARNLGTPTDRSVALVKAAMKALRAKASSPFDDAHEPLSMRVALEQVAVSGLAGKLVGPLGNVLSGVSTNRPSFEVGASSR